jgi:ABC-type sugar transport system substrate-binding protein
MSMKRIRWLVLGVLVAALAGVTALSATAAGSRSHAGLRIAVVIKGLDNPYFGAMAQGVREEAAKQHVTAVIQEAANINDQTGQADKLTALAAQNYDCYIVNPISATNLIQPLVKVKGKPIVNIDLPISSAAAKKAGVKILTYIGTDNVAAGKLGGKHLASLLPKGSQIARIGGIAGDPTSNARLKGFAQGVGGKLKIVQTVAADWDTNKALTAAQNILRAHPQVKGFLVANDTMVLGVVQALRTSGKIGVVKAIGVDGIVDALKAVKAGQETADISQYPYADGQMAVQACIAAARGKTLPAKVPAPVALITKANAARAIASYPRPMGSYPNPFLALMK